MGDFKDISVEGLLLFSLVLIFPVLILIRYKTKLVGLLFGGLVRMAVQLSLVGLYLHYLFELNSLWLNLGWLLVMIFVASSSISKSILQSWKTLFIPVFGAMISSLLVVCGAMIVLLGPDPIWDARYLIPLAGMVLGNTLQGNIVAFRSFFQGIKNNENEYFESIMNGATIGEATLPWFRKALIDSIGPMLAKLGTVGVVALPGMMTGQILAGAVPAEAVRYQIMIMMAIVSMMVLSVFCSLWFSRYKAFDSMQNFRKELFK